MQPARRGDLGGKPARAGRWGDGARLRPVPDGEPLPYSNAHVFLLAAGESLPPVWIAVCGHHIKDVEFEVLDPDMGQPCRDCQQRRATRHPQRTNLSVRSPGAHLHPQLRRPPLTGHSRKESNST